MRANKLAYGVVPFPCKDCPDRTVMPNCHDRCEKYLKAKEEQNRLREQLQLRSTVINYKKKIK